MVRISLHGRARVNIKQFFSGLVLGERSQQTFVTVKQVEFLMKFLSCMCTEDVSDVLFLVRLLIRIALSCCYSKSIVVTHIKRLGTFDDLLILAAENAGQNVSAAFWPASPPHDATARQRNGWPSLTTMKEFLLPCFPLPLQRKHVQCVRVGSQRHKCDGAGIKTKGRDYFTTWRRRNASLTTWRRPCYHFPLLDPFLIISVYS